MCIPTAADDVRAEVLKGMVAQHYITQEQANEATQEPMPTVKPSAELRPDNVWAEKAQEVLLNDPRLGATPQERRDKVLQGGLKVYTTEDPNMQQMADALSGERAAVRQAGFAAGARRDGTEDRLREGDDRQPAVQPVQVQPRHRRRRRAGGFELQGHDAGHDPGERLLAERPDRRQRALQRAGLPRVTTNAGGEGEGGIMNVDQATAQSVNCAYVRLSTSVGIDKVIDMAQKLGMRPNVAGRQPVNEWQVLTFTLGVISITPLEMANITATIAGDGVHHDPIFVSKVVEPDGKVLFDESGRPGTRVLDPDVAHCEVSILHGPIDDPNGTASGKGIPGYDAFGKTGTNDRQVSSAFLGGTSNLVTDVWHGVPEQDVPGAGFGAGVPNAIWRAFMIPALRGTPDDALRAPGPACDAPGKFVDPVLGRTTDVANHRPHLDSAAAAARTRTRAGARIPHLRLGPAQPPACSASPAAPTDTAVAWTEEVAARRTRGSAATGRGSSGSSRRWEDSRRTNS